ncbi:MAG TPA: hypothetical protein ENH86_00700 [Candidatus Jorgensenbacteria bacterium]|nr:hypothetical protein [Candidatus Jorgensenbacteria bacterium]
MPKHIKKKSISHKPRMKRTKKSFSTVADVRDILPKDEVWWDMVRNTGEKVSTLHNFHFIETPIVEQAELFEAGFGKGSFAAENDLCTFTIGRGQRLTLRADGAIPVVRSYIEHHLGYFSSPLRVYYHGPVFRRKGNKIQQSNQWGFIIIGDGDSVYDVSIMLTLLDFLRTLGFKDPVVKVNAAGCKVCRSTYRQKLKQYYRYRRRSLCEACTYRYEHDPIRLFVCEREVCGKIRADTPIILDYLCQSCNGHFQNVLELIEDNEINYVPDPYLVGDVGYYSKIIFEVYAHADASKPFARGGRYDYLAEQLGGRQLQSVGGVLYLDAVVDALREREEKLNQDEKPRVFFVAIGERAKKSSLSLMNDLRQHGFVVLEALGRKSLQAQLKAAEKSGVSVTLIYGQREVYEGAVMVREMDSGTQESVLVNMLISTVRKKIK